MDAQEAIPCSGAAAFMLYPHPIQGHAQPAEGVRAIALDSPSAVAAACAAMGGRVAQECTHLARGASATLANEPAPGVTSSPCSTRAVGSGGDVIFVVSPTPMIASSVFIFARRESRASGRTEQPGEADGQKEEVEQVEEEA